ncbi:MAG TPA: OmpA family protein [Methylomirabilota bacterium]|nr:OmpA family protein [Methylomirabilota bacterium]
MTSRIARVLVVAALALLPLGCARPVEPARVATMTAPAPAPAPAPTWPDAAPAPDLPTPEASAETFVAREELPDVHFASGEIHVERRDLAALDAAAAWLRANPSQLVIVEGYTDAAGPRAANLALAQRRARWVMDYLVTKGVPAERITAVARGEAGLLCADRSAACQSRNRRVHFLARESGPVQLSASPSR